MPDVGTSLVTAASTFWRYQVRRRRCGTIPVTPSAADHDAGRDRSADDYPEASEAAAPNNGSNLTSLGPRAHGKQTIPSIVDAHMLCATASATLEPSRSDVDLNWMRVGRCPGASPAR